MAVGMQSEESKVYYIVASYPSIEGLQRTMADLGFPGYDINRKLVCTLPPHLSITICDCFRSDESHYLQVGFYSESQDSRHATTIRFTSASSVQLSDFHLQAINEHLEKSLISDAGAVYSLPKCFDDLEKMKQDVMVHYWLAEVSMMD